jgi:hypothetical protein
MKAFTALLQDQTCWPPHRWATPFIEFIHILWKGSCCCWCLIDFMCTYWMSIWQMHMSRHGLMWMTFFCVRDRHGHNLKLLQKYMWYNYNDKNRIIRNWCNFTYRIGMLIIFICVNTCISRQEIGHFVT